MVVLVTSEKRDIRSNATELDDTPTHIAKQETVHAREHNKRTRNHTAINADKGIAIVQFNHQID
jgi:hypothetical protein